MGDLSDAQFVILVIVLEVSSVLSIVGSCFVVTSILYRFTRNNGQQLKREALFQFLLGLSISDILYTLGIALGPVMAPSGSISIFSSWAAGNQTTCNLSAALHVMGGMAGTFYNCAMSIHFWKTVQAAHKQRGQHCHDTRQVYAAHGITIFVSVGIMMAGLVTGTYHPHETLGMCFFSEDPPGCWGDDTLECVDKRGVYINQVRLLVAVLVSLASICFTVSLTRTVRANLRRTERYKSFSQLSTISNIGDDLDNSKKREGSTLSIFGRSSTNSRDEENASRDDEVGGRSSVFLELGTQASGRRSSKERINNENNSKEKEVSTQALWYMGVYLNSFLSPLIATIVLIATDFQASFGFFLLCLILFITAPMQGALNFFVYIRPRYIAWKLYLIKEQQQQQQQPDDDDADGIASPPFKPPSAFTILQKATLENVPTAPPSQRRRRRAPRNPKYQQCRPISFAAPAAAEVQQESTTSLPKETTTQEADDTAEDQDPAAITTSSTTSLNQSTPPTLHQDTTSDKPIASIQGGK